jgi:hypothetical protein
MTFARKSNVIDKVVTARATIAPPEPMVLRAPIIYTVALDAIVPDAPVAVRVPDDIDPTEPEADIDPFEPEANKEPETAIVAELDRVPGDPVSDSDPDT